MARCECNTLIEITDDELQMASRKTLFELFQTVEDDQLEEFLSNSRDLDIRLAALRELTRDDRDPAVYETEISETIDAFFLLLAAHLGSSRDTSVKPYILKLLRKKYAAKPAQRKEPKAEMPSANSRSWKWPTTEVFDSAGVKGNFDDWHQVSAIGLFGYTVGKTNGWRRDLRHSFLADFVELELPEIVTNIFADKYGAPLTSQRLEALAKLLASHVRNAKRRDSHSMRFAISDWEDDLSFLKERYSSGSNLGFIWPNTQAPR